MWCFLDPEAGQLSSSQRDAVRKLGEVITDTMRLEQELAKAQARGAAGPAHEAGR